MNVSEQPAVSAIVQICMFKNCLIFLTKKKKKVRFFFLFPQFNFLWFFLFVCFCAVDDRNKTSKVRCIDWVGSQVWALKFINVVIKDPSIEKKKCEGGYRPPEGFTNIVWLHLNRPFVIYKLFGDEIIAAYATTKRFQRKKKQNTFGAMTIRCWQVQNNNSKKKTR